MVTCLGHQFPLPSSPQLRSSPLPENYDNILQEGLSHWQVCGAPVSFLSLLNLFSEPLATKLVPWGLPHPFTRLTRALVAAPPPPCHHQPPTHPALHGLQLYGLVGPGLGSPFRLHITSSYTPHTLSSRAPFLSTCETRMFVVSARRVDPGLNATSKPLRAQR